MFSYLLRVLFLFCFFIIVGCTYDRQVDKVIDYAQQLLRTQPDSSLMVLDKIKDRRNQWPKSQRMHYELVYAQAQNKAFIPFTTDSVVLELADYYNHHGSANERMIANYMVGSAYRDLEDAPLALKYLNIAADVAEDNSEDCELKVQMGIHSQMGALYQNVSAFENERLEDYKAEKLAWQIGDTIAALHLMWARAVSLYDCGFQQLSTEVLDSVDEFMRINQVQDNSINTYFMRIAYYQDNQDIQKVSDLFKEYEERKLISSDSFNMGFDELPYYKSKGYYYLMVQRPDSAVLLYKKLISLIPNSYISKDEQYGLLRDSYSGLTCAYNQMHLLDSVEKYSKLTCVYNDSLVKENASQQLLYVQSIYNYTKFQDQAQYHEHRASRLKIVIAIVVIVIVMLGILVWQGYQSRLRKECQKLTDANKEYQSLLQEMDKSTKELRLFKKDSERFLHQKEEEIQKLQTALTMFRGNEIDMEQWDKERSTLDCEVAHHLHTLSARGKIATLSELDCLSKVACDAFPHFFDKISQEAVGLSTQEILVCVLIRFRFIPSEIVVLTGYSSQRVTNIKASINKKLFGKSGAKTLEAHLLALK